MRNVSDAVHCLPRYDGMRNPVRSLVSKLRDRDHNVHVGATSLRIGAAIFGPRPTSSEPVWEFTTKTQRHKVRSGRKRLPVFAFLATLPPSGSSLLASSFSLLASDLVPSPLASWRFSPPLSAFSETLGVLVSLW
jgi:hypothetical protein